MKCNESNRFFNLSIEFGTAVNNKNFFCICVLYCKTVFSHNNKKKQKKTGKGKKGGTAKKTGSGKKVGKGKASNIDKKKKKSAKSSKMSKK